MKSTLSLPLLTTTSDTFTIASSSTTVTSFHSDLTSLPSPSVITTWYSNSVKLLALITPVTLGVADSVVKNSTVYPSNFNSAIEISFPLLIEKSNC